MNRFLIYANAAFLTFLACTSKEMKQYAPPAISQEFPSFDLEGHRGARGLLPENTVPAMQKALELGVTTLEMDVHISQDGKVLLSHDPFINPEHELLPSGEEIPSEGADKYILYQMPYSQIRRFDVGSKPYSRFPHQKLLKTYKPLLSEVIDSTQAYIEQRDLPQVFYNIETKSKPEGDGKFHPEPEEFVAKLMEVVDEKQLRPYVIIQSFDPRTLQVVHQKYPDVMTSLLVENLDGLEKNVSRLGFTPTVYSPYYQLITPSLVDAVHSHGMKLIPWTVNDLEEMKQLRQMGVDGLISDYPNLYSEL